MMVQTRPLNCLQLKVHCTYVYYICIAFLFSYIRKIILLAVNVAYGKPANQSSSVRGGDAAHGNDGDLTTVHENKYCTETKAEDSPWWQVDLLHAYPIRVVRIVTRGCCGEHFVC